MALETATYINQLVQTNPVGSDPLADADAHLRLLKSTIKTTFPNITGQVTATQAMLNNPFPVGGIIMWSGSVGTIPSGWLLCDGNNGTPNLRDRFIIGAGNSFAIGATGGSTTITADNLPAHTHTFSGSTGGAGSHSHSVNDPGHAHGYSVVSTVPGTISYGGGGPGIGGVGSTTASSGTGISINSVGDHTHSFSGTTSSVGSGTAYYPPYYALAFIMKAAY